MSQCTLHRFHTQYALQDPLTDQIVAIYSPVNGIATILLRIRSHRTPLCVALCCGTLGLCTAFTYNTLCEIRQLVELLRCLHQLIGSLPYCSSICTSYTIGRDLLAVITPRWRLYQIVVCLCVTESSTSSVMTNEIPRYAHSSFADRRPADENIIRKLSHSTRTQFSFEQEHLHTNP